MLFLFSLLFIQIYLRASIQSEIACIEKKDIVDVDNIKLIQAPQVIWKNHTFPYLGLSLENQPLIYIAIYERKLPFYIDILPNTAKYLVYSEVAYDNSLHFYGKPFRPEDHLKYMDMKKYKLFNPKSEIIKFRIFQSPLYGMVIYEIYSRSIVIFRGWQNPVKSYIFHIFLNKNITMCPPPIYIIPEPEFALHPKFGNELYYDYSIICQYIFKDGNYSIAKKKKNKKMIYFFKDIQLKIKHGKNLIAQFDCDYTRKASENGNYYQFINDASNLLTMLTTFQYKIKLKKPISITLNTSKLIACKLYLLNLTSGNKVGIDVPKNVLVKIIQRNNKLVYEIEDTSNHIDQQIFPNHILMSIKTVGSNNNKEVNYNMWKKFTIDIIIKKC